MKKNAYSYQEATWNIHSSSYQSFSKYAWNRQIDKLILKLDLYIKQKPFTWDFIKYLYSMEQNEILLHLYFEYIQIEWKL